MQIKACCCCCVQNSGGLQPPGPHVPLGLTYRLCSTVSPQYSIASLEKLSPTLSK